MDSEERTTTTRSRKPPIRTRIAEVKAAYSRIDPRGLTEQNGFTIQLQVFYY